MNRYLMLGQNSWQKDLIACGVLKKVLWVKREFVEGEYKLHQAKQSVSRGELIGILFEEEPEGPATFLVGDGGVENLEVHGKGEAMEDKKLKVIEELLKGV